MSSASSWATGYWCITTHWISSGTRNGLHFEVFGHLECLHLQSEIPWERGPHANQNSCCIHNIHARRFPLEAWCWYFWARDIQLVHSPNRLEYSLSSEVQARSSGWLWCRDGRFPEAISRVKMLSSSSVVWDSEKPHASLRSASLFTESSGNTTY